MNSRWHDKQKSIIHKAMWFVKVISPNNIPSRKTEWNRRIRFYVWLLCRLKWLYARGAISDTISFGSVMVIHNLRDYWFEQELQRFGIDISRHLNSHTLPITLKHKYCLPRIFNWAESLQIQSEDKSYIINRTKRLTIETDMNGVLKVSTPMDLFFCSAFTVENDGSREKRQDDKRLQDSFSQPKPDVSSSKRNKQKIAVKDTLPSQDTEPQKESHTTKHQGFEENDAF